MKKRLAFFCGTAVVCALSAGCGSADVTESTVELKKNGKIVEYAIEDFSESYYDADELQSYIDSTVKEWTDANEGTVKVKRSEVEDGTACLTIQYDSAQTFSEFNGVECFAGSIVQAQTAGYDFDMDFVQVNSKEQEENEGSVIEAEIQPVVSGDTVTEDDDLKVFILRDHVNIKVPGKIVYVSDHVQIEDGNTVTADEDDGSAEHDVLLYVLYK